MATKLSFGKERVNVSQRIEPKTGEMVRTDKPLNIKTTVVRPASTRSVKAEE